MMELIALCVIVSSIMMTSANKCYNGICDCSLKWFPVLNQSLSTVDCGHLGIKTIPYSLSHVYEAGVFVGNRLETAESLAGLGKLESLVYLDLSHNRINSLSKLSLNGESLQILLLNSNRLDYLPPMAFADMTNLNILSIDVNHIESIHDDAFSGLRRMKTLNMSSNRLTYINPSWFENLDNLEILDISNNNIHKLENGLFVGLKRLVHLYLNDNDLHTLPEYAFSKVPTLRFLYLQGNHLKKVRSRTFQNIKYLDELWLGGNHFARFHPGTFYKINVTNLFLNALPELMMIDPGTFMDLPMLKKVELHSNPQLKFIDGCAFERTPQLEELFLHNNKLRAVGARLVRTLDKLSHISVYGNPLYCDCNVHWILDELQNKNFHFTKIEEAVCDSPNVLKGAHVSHRERGYFPERCKPVVVPLFKTYYDVLHGENFTLDCRGIGIPPPTVFWEGPNNVKLLNSSIRGHIAVAPSGTLMIDGIKARDSGYYTCVVMNPLGRDERKVQILVKTTDAKIIILGIKTTSVTVTWNGTHAMHHYVIICKKNKKSLNSVPLFEYMRTYTVTGLESEQHYEICIGLMMGGTLRHNHCVKVTTKPKSYMSLGIIDTGKYIFGAILGAIATIALSACLGLLIYRAYKRRQRMMRGLYGDNTSQVFLTRESFSDITPITYENMIAHSMEESFEETDDTRPINT